VEDSTTTLISDTGNDQTLLNSVWRITARTGREVMMTGAFAGRNVGESFPVVSAVAKLIGADGVPYPATAHEALYDANPLQIESLLSVHQALRNPRNGIDDQATCERDLGGILANKRHDSTMLLFLSTLMELSVSLKSSQLLITKCERYVALL
jgi:hypothetical protein